MKFPKAKFLIPIAGISVLLLILVWYFGFRSSTNHYFIVTYSKAIKKGNAVLIENVKVGEVEKITKANGENQGSVVMFGLDDDYSIPANSRVELADENGSGDMSIKISVLASRKYIQAGDTIFLDDADLVKEKTDSIDLTNLNHQSESLVYKVQLFVSNSKIEPGSSVFKGLNEIFIMEGNGVYKYYFGNVGTLEEAKNLKNHVMKKGIGDAFIVPFFKGKRISIPQARKYEK